MRIRAYEPTDAAILSRILRRNAIEVNSRDYPAAVIEALCRDFDTEKIAALAENMSFLVSMEGDAVRGFGCISESFVQLLFVDPAHHREGNGTALLNSLEAIAESDCVYANSSLTAEGFYLRRGYVVIGRGERGRYGAFVGMKKQLG